MSSEKCDLQAMPELESQVVYTNIICLALQFTFINSIFIDSARFVEWEHFIIPYQTSSSLINVFIKYFYIQILIAADNSKKMPQNFISCRASLEEWFPGQKMPRLNESEAKRHGLVVGLASLTQ